jgi:aspartate racemase
MSDTTSETVGVLGGMSSQSTIEYYRRLDAGINAARGGHSAADLLIRSVDFADVEAFVADERWDAAGDYLADAALDLEAGGADFVLVATNTMHRVAPRITAALSVPLLHIVDVTADAVTDRGIGTVGVLGTEAVTTGEFYRDRLHDHGLDVVTPGPDDRAAVDRIVFDELTRGVVREASRERFLGVVDGLIDAGAEGVVLGCTEFDLLVEASDRDGVPLFDTTALHVAAAVERCLRRGHDGPPAGR